MAILVAVTMVVLLGFLGLAVDGGHLYLTKTELQNSADACSLAASYELTNPTALTTAAYSRAEAAGRTVARKNLVNFQGSAIVDGNVVVSFGTELKASTTWMTASAAASTTPRPSYVRCTLTRPGIAMFFMPLLGFGSQTVVSLATAGLVPSQSSCVVPVSLCTQGSTTTPFGLISGKSYTSPSEWIWIGLATKVNLAEFTNFLAGKGACSLPVGQQVGEVTSNGAAPENAWNDHFGSNSDVNGRLVVTMIIDCSVTTKSSATTPILGLGCARMLQPLASKKNNALTYQGLATAAGSPCVSSGIPGGSASTGPIVPALVQ